MVEESGNESSNQVDTALQDQLVEVVLEKTICESLEIPHGLGYSGWLEEVLHRRVKNVVCRDTFSYQFDTRIFISWIDQEILGQACQSITILLVGCEWVQFRRALVSLMTQLMKFLRVNCKEAFETEKTCLRNSCYGLLADTDNLVRSDIVEVLMAEPGLETEMQRLRNLLTDPRSQRVRYLVAKGVHSILIENPQSARSWTATFGELLLKMTRSDPSMLVRIAALGAITKMFEMGLWLLHLNDVLELLNYEIPSTFAKPLAALIWAVIGDNTDETLDLKDRICQLMQCLRQKSIHMQQANLLLFYLDRYTWHDLAKLLVDSDTDLGGEPLVFELLVNWTEYCADFSKPSSKLSVRELENVFRLVLAIVDRFQNTEAMVEQGIRFFCFACLQNNYRDLDFFVEKCEQLRDLFLYKSGPTLIRAVGDFWQYLYEDEDYRPWVASQLEVVVGVLNETPHEFRKEQLAVLCGSVLEPRDGLGDLEVEALTRYLVRKIEVEKDMDENTLMYVQRLVELGQSQTDHALLVLKTVGKYAIKAKEYDWPRLRFSQASSAWLIDLLWKCPVDQAVQLTQCTLGLWYYDVISSEVIDNLRLVASENPDIAKEIETIELT